MNIQTEHLEDHTARFTVEIEPERLDKAKQTAARELAKKVNIPGFRKGKVPYHILVQYVGEASIVQDAVDDLSQEIYRETIEQSDITPYGPGSWHDFKLEPTPTFIYTVPLQPTVETGDYRAVRLPFEAREVTDNMLEAAMKRLQEQEALTEESSQPAQIGNRVTVDIHSEFADDPPDSPDEEGEQVVDEAAAKPRFPEKGESFIHEHDAPVTLDTDDDPILPGFCAALLGAAVGQELEFELSIPAEYEAFEEAAGRAVKFHVTVKKIEVVTLPTLNDDLAARITQSEEEPLTLLQLRVRMRENMQKELERRGRSDYANQVLDEMVKIARIAYPEAMVNEQIDGMIEDLEGRLRQQGITLDTYLKVTGKTQDDIRAEYYDSAVNIIRRSLVLSEIARAENIQIADSDVDAQIEEMVQQFGEQADQFRNMFKTPTMISSIRNDLYQQRVLDRIVEIAKGEITEEPEQAVEAETVVVSSGDDEEVTSDES